MDNDRIIEIYTDGSCNPKYKIGAWVAIIFVDEKIILDGYENNTTHNSMELLASIKALEFIEEKKYSYKQIKLYTDSQYLTGLTDRKEKLENKDFLTKKGTSIQNADLVKKIIQYIEKLNIEFIKVKAHLKKTDTTNFNIEVDKLSRKIVRQCVDKLLKNNEI
ncbi:MAG: hypothetical protein A2086_10875 [Spirochaetes bacterium GWD1_27_9]|nr:MAG: hypothetical protein A2Z98_09950 [Spirochaetes bacterium GWB1_27_13]OHD28292.1 MAG: hypothetical protein A2Y34_09760 [Spirochaetes bacterium GWC1_27_15]OHD35059.1 MAG: hypothetical protein A2086_10875 [Spirochaetes bacterium GWD1_27_9]